MSSPIQPNKTYGVLHTESYFSFVGFAKKIESDEVQKIDIYLDDKLIDTIKADKFIQKLDDMYDVENQAFSYNLPVEYIGQKATISFKNHDSQEELLNSPYILIDKNHEDFNEAKFMHSLSEPISEELKDIYKPNSIGFLATKENLEDEEFVEFINEIIRDFPNADFKALYFNTKDEKVIKEKFQAENLEYLQIKNIKDIFENLEIYLSNYQRNYKYPPENLLISLLRLYANDVLFISLNLQRNKGLNLIEYEKSFNTYFKTFFDNFEELGFNTQDIEKYGNSYHELYFKKAADIFGLNLDFSLKEEMQKAYVYYNIQLSLSNHNFIKFATNFLRTFLKLKGNI